VLCFGLLTFCLFRIQPHYAQLRKALSSDWAAFAVENRCIANLDLEDKYSPKESVRVTRQHNPRRNVESLERVELGMHLVKFNTEYRTIFKLGGYLDLTQIPTYTELESGSGAL
jgi:hypothetical protein